MTTVSRRTSAVPIAILFLSMAGTVCPGASFADESALPEPDRGLGNYSLSLFSTVTLLSRCGDFRVFVAYLDCTDMLFLDRLVPNGAGSAYEARDGAKFKEFDFHDADYSIHRVSCKIVKTTFVRIDGIAEDSEDQSFTFTILYDTMAKSYKFQHHDVDGNH